MKIAKEGWGIVGAVFAIALALTFIHAPTAVLAWVAFVFCWQFFRQPNRPLKTVDKEVLSPADGRVIFVGKGTSPVDNRDAIKISIFMNVFNVHANHSPISGKVLHSERFAGSFFNAALDKASTQNERHLIRIEGEHGMVDSMQIAGLLARRVLCYANVGDTLTAGKKYGFIRFGSRVDLFLPPSCQVLVSISDKVQAGVHTIANFE